MRRKTAKGLLGAGVLLGTLGVLIDPAGAAGATVEDPGTFFDETDTTIVLDGSPDPHTGLPRLVEVAGGEYPEDCNHLEGDSDPDDDDDLTDGFIGPSALQDAVSGACYTVQVEFSNVSNGTVTLDGSNGGGHPSGVEILNAQDPAENNFNFFGTLEEVNNALLTLTFDPDSDYETTFPPAGDRAVITLRVKDGKGHDATFVDDEGATVGDGTVEIDMRIEQPNDPPELTLGPEFHDGSQITDPSFPEPVPVPAGETQDLWDGFEVTDDDLEDFETDDVLLAILWADEGTIEFDFGPSALCVGAPSAMFGVGVCPSIPEFVTEALALAGAAGAPTDSGDFGSGLSDPSKAKGMIIDGIDDANDILDRLTYTAPAGDADDIIHVFITDLGNNGLPLDNVVPGVVVPDVEFAFDEIDIEVRDADNDAPTVTPNPAAAAVDELASTPVSFTVEDLDAECDLTVTDILVGGGTLTGSPAPGLTGSPEELTTALTGMTFTAFEFTTHPGQGSVEVVVHDNGCGPGPDPVPEDDEEASGIATFTIEEDGVTDNDPDTENNSPPVLTVPSPIGVTEGVPFDLPNADIGLVDPDVGADDLTLTITPTGGTTNADGVTTDSLADLNTLLDNLTFTATQDVDDVDEVLTPGITLSVSDGGHNPVPDPFVEGTDVATIDVNVADDDGDQNPAANDPPVIVGPTDESATEGVALALGDFVVTDPDVGTGTMDVTIEVPVGSGTTNSTGADNVTLAEVNDLLDALTFTPAQDVDFADETDVPITITVDDDANTGTGGELSDEHIVLVDVDDDDLPPVNDPPLIVGPDAASGDEGVAGDVGDFTVTDPDVDDGTGLLDVTVQVVGGGGTLSSTGQNDITLAAVNTLLDGLTFTPDQDVDTDDESVDLLITVDDDGNTGTGGAQQDTHTVTVSVLDDDVPQPANDPPVITGPATGAASEGTAFAFDDFTVTDPDVDDGDGLLDLVLTSPAGAGAFNGASTNGLTLVQVNSVLDALTFTPADDVDTTDEAFQVTITVSDRGNFGTGGALQDSHVIDMTAEDDDNANDPPTLDGPGAQAVTEGGQIAFTGPLAITVGDPDAAGNDLLMQIGSTGGEVTAAAVPDTIGTLAELQAVLDDLVFTAGSPGNASITITVNDQGATGTGGAQSAVLTIPITVNAAQVTTTTTSTTLGGGGGGTTTTTTAGPNVGAGGAAQGGAGGSTLPRTGADLLVLVGFALVLAGAGGLLTGRRGRLAAR